VCHRNSRNSRAKTWEPSPGFPEQQIRDARARETDARLRGFAERAIAAVPTSGYRYVDALGINNYVEKLKAGLEQVSRFRLKDPGDEPHYDDWTNEVFLGEADDPAVARHEILHAYQDAIDLYLDTFVSADDRELAESMTHAQEYIEAATWHLRNMEDAINGREACKRIRHHWKSFWHKLKVAFGDDEGKSTGFSMGWRVFSGWASVKGEGSPRGWVLHTRPMTPADAKRTMELLGLKVSCEELRDLYNRVMYNKGVLDETRPGKCCTVKCPEGLPDCFK